MRKKCSAKGFTLIELLVVISILGLLMSVVVPNIQKAQNRAKEAAVKAIMHTLQAEVEGYAIDTGAYPEGELSCSALIGVLQMREIKNPFTGKVYSDQDLSGKIVYVAQTAGYSLTGYGQSPQAVMLVLTNI